MRKQRSYDRGIRPSSHHQDGIHNDGSSNDVDGSSNDVDVDGSNDVAGWMDGSMNSGRDLS